MQQAWRRGHIGSFEEDPQRPRVLRGGAPGFPRSCRAQDRCRLALRQMCWRVCAFHTEPKLTRGLRAKLDAMMDRLPSISAQRGIGTRRHLFVGRLRQTMPTRLPSQHSPPASIGPRIVDQQLWQAHTVVPPSNPRRNSRCFAHGRSLPPRVLPCRCGARTWSSAQTVVQLSGLPLRPKRATGLGFATIGSSQTGGGTRIRKRRNRQRRTHRPPPQRPPFCRRRSSLPPRPRRRLRVLESRRSRSSSAIDHISRRPHARGTAIPASASTSTARSRAREQATASTCRAVEDRRTHQRLVAAPPRSFIARNPRDQRVLPPDTAGLSASHRAATRGGAYGPVGRPDHAEGGLPARTFSTMVYQTLGRHVRRIRSWQQHKGQLEDDRFPGVIEVNRGASKFKEAVSNRPLSISDARKGGAAQMKGRCRHVDLAGPRRHPGEGIGWWRGEKVVALERGGLPRPGNQVNIATNARGATT